MNLTEYGAMINKHFENGAWTPSDHHIWRFRKGAHRFQLSHRMSKTQGLGQFDPHVSEVAVFIIREPERDFQPLDVRLITTISCLTETTSAEVVKQIHRAMVKAAFHRSGGL